MKIASLVRDWETSAKANLTNQEYRLKLPLEDAARIAALAEMYPRRNQEEIIAELLTAALDELEQSLPYIAGTEVVGEDECGDPMYEDVGPTPRFLHLSKKYNQLLKQQQQAANH